MAIDLEAGDIISFQIEDDVYGLARVLRIEGRSSSNLFHLEIYDATLGAGPGAETPDGDWASRTHELPDIDSLGVAIDHLAITAPALAESDPLIVDYREVVSADLVGYRAFIASMREHYIQQGMLRNPKVADEEIVELGDDEEEFVDEESEENHKDTDEEDIDHDDIAQEDDGSDDDEDNPETVTVELMPWHISAFDMPIPLLAKGWTDILTEKGGEEGGIIEWLGERWSVNNVEEINALVEALLGGDYGAGHELMIYGDGGVEALAVHLNDKLDAQQAEDIVNILADAGSIKGYEAIAEFFLMQRGGNSPLSIVASRGFCYAVMRTGGVPEALHAHLDKLDTIIAPELVGDVIEAREAIAQAEKMASADADASSSLDNSTNITQGKSFGDLGM